MSRERQVRVSNIAVDRGRRRRFLRPERVEELAASMMVEGLREPIELEELGLGRYRLMEGLHRLTAARQLKWKSIQSFIRIEIAR